MACARSSLKSSTSRTGPRAVSAGGRSRVNIDQGQYPPPQRQPRPSPRHIWNATRDGYGCSISRACAAWLGALDPTVDLVRRALTNPSAFIAVQCNDGKAVMIWPIDFKAFAKE